MSNWLVTLAASIVGRNGLVFTGELKNDVIGALLLATVVLPALIGAFLWAAGFRGSRAGP